MPRFRSPAPQPSRTRGGQRRARSAGALTPISLAAARAEAPAAPRSTARKYETVRTLDAPQRLDRARATISASSPSTPKPPASIRCSAHLVRLLARGGAGRSLLCSARPPRRRADGAATCSAPDSSSPGPDSEQRRARRAEAAARRPRRPQGRAEPEIRLADLRAARHRRRAYDDTMLISYVLDAGKGGHGMDDLAEALARPRDHRFQRCRRHRARRRSPSTASPSTRRPNTPPKTPTSRLRLWQR